MSFTIDINNINDEIKEFIKQECNILPKIDKFNENPSNICIFNIIDNNIILPLNLWTIFYDKFPNNYNNSDFSFTGTLIDNDKKSQVNVAKLALEQLYDNHSCLLALHTGFGKTITAIYLACQLKQKTLVVYYNTSTLHSQWKRTINEFTNAKIHIIEGNKPIDKNADIYLIGLIKLINSNINLQFGTVIIDEVHMILTQNYIQSLQKVFPTYLIGLSATPDKKNGTDKILYKYFGSRELFIVRKETKEFTVIKYETDFSPSTRFNKKGDLDWTFVIESLSINKDRQQFIADIIKQYNDRTILVLSKRVCECIGCSNKCIHSPCIGLYKLLQDHDVEEFTGNKKEYKDSHILIGTFAKLGVGFDNKNMNMLVLCSDTIDVRQYEGRIRTENCLIIDIVDNFSVLEKHWEIRKEWYLSKGATIERIKRESKTVKRAIPKRIFSKKK